MDDEDFHEMHFGEKFIPIQRVSTN